MFIAVSFLPVLAHANTPSMPGRRVAAGALPHLEADATSGAAGRPGGPGSPASIPGTVGDLHSRALTLPAATLWSWAVTGSGPAEAGSHSSAISVSTGCPWRPRAKAPIYGEISGRTGGDALIPLGHAQALLQAGALLHHRIPATVRVLSANAGTTCLMKMASLQGDLDHMLL